jgi:hypothetical protein
VVYTVVPPTKNLLAPATESREADTRPPVVVSATASVDEVDLKSSEISFKRGLKDAGGKE